MDSFLVWHVLVGMCLEFFGLVGSFLACFGLFWHYKTAKNYKEQGEDITTRWGPCSSDSSSRWKRHEKSCLVQEAPDLKSCELWHFLLVLPSHRMDPPAHDQARLRWKPGVCEDGLGVPAFDKGFDDHFMINSEPPTREIPGSAEDFIYNIIYI